MSTLPELRALVDRLAAGIPARDLTAAFDDITASYQGGSRRTDVSSRTQALAYALGRAPATFGAVERVLREIAAARPEWAPRSVLDLGAGTGSASWAAVAVFEAIETVELVERSEAMSRLGAELASASSDRRLRDASWLRGEAAGAPDGTWDLVIASYVLGEVPDADRADAVSAWYGAATDELVIVEPGTPDGFEVVRRARERLIARGATISAPCPHDAACPMPAGDWCHFGVRVARSRLQRRVKSGVRGYEDEKYSYVVASKQGAAERGSRVLRRPEIRGGHVRLRLCAPDGLEETVVARRHAERYRKARKTDWGGSFGGA